MPRESHSPESELDVLRARVLELESLNRSVSGELQRAKQQLNALGAQFAAVREELHRREGDPDMLDLGAPAARSSER